MKPEVQGFFDGETNTISYVVVDPKSSQCAIIDSVLDFDPESGRTHTESADKIIQYISRNDLSVEWLLETHAHADHLSAAPYLKEKLGGRIAIGEHITDVQNIFRKIFNFEDSFPADGSQFDELFADGDQFKIGGLDARVMHTPGHTPACVTYIIGDTAFVGDTLFMPDYGTARVDFPGGDAETLYRSIHKIFDLPNETRVFLCHDYGTDEREEFKWETTVREEREKNIHIHEMVTLEEFVKMRNERDATLSMPTLILPSVQVNIRAGHFPPAEDNGIRYLKIPLNQL